MRWGTAAASFKKNCCNRVMNLARDATDTIFADLQPAAWKIFVCSNSSNHWISCCAVHKAARKASDGCDDCVS